jgi:P4 family phage/plasmid primase-like protien
MVCYDYPLPPFLTEAHGQELQASGLTPEQIRRTGHFSVTSDRSQQILGLPLPGLVFQYRNPQGRPYLKANGQVFYRLKPDWDANAVAKQPKYLSPKGAGCRPYFSQVLPNWPQVIASPKIPIIETEGEKKADCGCALGEPTIGFSGVDGWVDRCPRPDEPSLDDSRPLPELAEIAWGDRTVWQCYDSDIVSKQAVRLALQKRAIYLQEECHAHPQILLLPNELDGSKNGMDDFIVRHGIDAFRALKQVAQPSLIRKQRGQQVIWEVNLSEPNIRQKVVLAWSVLKETWAYRAGIGWYEFQGNCWRPVTEQEFKTDLIKFMDAQQWDDRRTSTVAGIVNELRARLQVKHEQWNPASKLAFLNGTFDVQTEKFQLGHQATDYLTKLRPYQFPDLSIPFNGQTACPHWMAFLADITAGDCQVQALIQAWFKYAVLPRSRQHKAEIEKSLDLFGPKGTGKGTLLDVLIQLVGSDNVGPASPDTFKNPEGLAQLIDKDLAVDTDSSGFLANIGAYNKVVSNEPVEVKKLYHDRTTTRLGVVIIRAYNAFIQVPTDAEGLDRRLTVIPFQHSPAVVNPQLAEQLRAELPGILAWAWQVSIPEMKHRILTAGTIRAVAEASLERFVDNTPEFQFLMDIFPQGSESIKASELYQRYQKWCQSNHHHPKSQHKLAPIIQRLGCRRSPKTNGCYFYTIPVMSQFDVARHLGLTQSIQGDARPSRDLHQDISKPELARDRDICRPLEPVIPLNTNWVEPTQDTVIEKQECHLNIPNLPKLDGERILESSFNLPVGPEPPSSASVPGTELIEIPPLPADWQPQRGDYVGWVQQPGVYWTIFQVLDSPNSKQQFWKLQALPGTTAATKFSAPQYVWEREALRPVSAPAVELPLHA